MRKREDDTTMIIKNIPRAMSELMRGEQKSSLKMIMKGKRSISSV
jgi:hypothetical protein